MFFFRLALRALGIGDLGQEGAPVSKADAPSAHTAGLRRTVLFSLAHCYSKRSVANRVITGAQHAACERSPGRVSKP